MYAGKMLRMAIVLSISLIAGETVLAQSKTGTTIGQFLLIEPSARTAAMGNAGVSMYGEIAASFYNPAAAAQLTGSDAQATYGLWLADITYNYVAAGIRLGGYNTIVFSVTALNSGQMDVRTIDQPEGTGERFSVNDLGFGVGYSRRITERFSAGVHVTYAQETIWHSTMNALSLSFGVMYYLPFNAYLGASISNFGTQGRFDGRDLRIRYDQNSEIFGDNSSLPAALYTENFPLPILFRVGVGVPISLGAANRVTLAVDAFQPSDNTNSVSVGGEWTFVDTFSLRGGYQHLFQEDSETGLTLGLGLNYSVSRYEIRVDYAWNDFGRVGDVQRFTVGFGF